jgi:hypothetical protein
VKTYIENYLRESLLIEEHLEGKHLVVVDIQEAYESGFSHWLDEFIQFLNENHQMFSKITFLFNGPDLGFPDENEYQYWWLNNELDEDVLLHSNFYDKGYAFFRFCMDEGMDEDSIANLIGYMIETDVNDTRELDKAWWDEYVDRYGDKDLRDLMEFSDDCLSIPDLINEIGDYSNVVMCGGGETECLREVELAFRAIGKPYNLLNRYVY